MECTKINALQGQIHELLMGEPQHTLRRKAAAPGSPHTHTHTHTHTHPHRQPVSAKIRGAHWRCLLSNPLLPSMFTLNRGGALNFFFQVGCADFFSGRGVRPECPKWGACELIFASERGVLWTEMGPLRTTGEAWKGGLQGRTSPYPLSRSLPPRPWTHPQVFTMLHIPPSPHYFGSRFTIMTKLSVMPWFTPFSRELNR